MKVREVWSHRRLAASGTVVPLSGSLGGFFCTTAGTVVISEGEGSGGAEIVSSFTVVAATWYPLPFRTPKGAYATLGGGAVGTFAVKAV